MELGNLVKLKVLSLSNNMITGTIPVALGNLVNMNQLVLSHNRLTGALLGHPTCHATV